MGNANDTDRVRPSRRFGRNPSSTPTIAGIAGIAMISILIALWPVASFSQISDSDADLVPDAFDNCLVTPNGPNEASNQVDTDLDGYGNACDPDYDNNGTITATDYGLFIPTQAGPGALTDHDGNGVVTVTDFAIFLDYFTRIINEPGPSGLACAGTVPCLP